MDQQQTSQSSTNNDNNNKETRENIPKPADDKQFVTIWKREHDKRRLLQIINNNQLRDCPQAQQKIYDTISELVQTGTSDKDIYDKLHELVHNEIVKTDEYKRKHTEFVNNDRRSSSRTYQITNILKQLPVWWNTKDKQMLDVGCSEGAITAALGQEIGIKAEHIHGCDVREVKATEGFQFKMLEDPHKLPWKQGEFQIVTALMSLHHVADPTKMLAEINRVLDPEGILLIREHNCEPPELSVVFDLMHGFYAMVWAEPREMDDFREHFADYHNRKYWTAKLEEAGFEELRVYQKQWQARGNEFANPMEHYFAVFKKKGNDKLQVQQRDNRQQNDRWNNRGHDNRNYNSNYRHNNNYNYHDNRSYDNKRSRDERDRDEHRNYTNRRPDDRYDRNDRRDERDRKDKHIPDNSGIDNSAEAQEKRRKKYG